MYVYMCTCPYICMAKQASVYSCLWLHLGMCNICIIWTTSICIYIWYIYIYVYIYIWQRPIHSWHGKCDKVYPPSILAQTLRMNYSMNYFTFLMWLYSGRRRLFPTEYCQNWWHFVDLQFLFLLKAAAGAFFQLTIVDNYDKLYYSCFHSTL